jgi:hypothetical protein
MRDRIHAILVGALIAEKLRSSAVDDARLEMPCDGVRQNAAFDVAPLANECFPRVVMSDSFDTLLDDRPLIQVGGDIVSCGADKLDPPGTRLMVRVGLP